MSENNTFSSWTPTDPKLIPFHDGISAFVAAHLEPFAINSIDSIDSGSKSIADPLVGYVHLREWEVAFLETMLFQRLRRIRQVGLAHLIYPTLGYSRFEHTLGVLGNVMKLMDRIRQIYSMKEFRDGEILDTLDSFEIPLRLAALFHDIGHCIFSHVSERVLGVLKGSSKYPSVKEIINAYTKALGLPKALAPAEVLSIAIISSPEVRAFANRLNIPGKTNENLGKWFDAAASFIAGSPLHKNAKTVFLAQILSSGLDADKFDYMQRDARYTGIPLGIDLVRLYDKLRVFRLRVDELPSGLEYLKKVTGPNDQFFVLGLTHGGQFAFEEFCIARASLYDKIYLHQKVRSAEAQLSHLLGNLPVKLDQFNECHRWLYLSEDIVDHDDLPLPGDTRSGELFPRECADILRLKPIRFRQILKRSFALGLRNSLSEPPGASKSEDMTPTWTFILELKSDNNPFLKRLKTEILEVARLTKNIIEPELVEQIIVDVPEHTRVQQGATGIYIKQPITLPRRWALPIDQIAEYYRHRVLSYIFAPSEISGFVAAAAEKVIWESYGLEFEQSEFLSDGIAQKFTEIKEQLSRGDYYQSTPALKPKSNFLLTAAAQEKIAKVVDNLKEFRSYKNDHVTLSLTSEFLMQFPEGLQETALDLLTMVRVLEPAGLVKKVLEEYTRTSHIAKVLVIPIGSVKDSAAHLSYYFKNPAVQISMLSDSNIASAPHLILFDDNVNSGKQTLNILAEWLGVQLPSDVKLNETHVTELKQESKNIFRNLSLHFIFGVGPSDADKKLPEMLSRYLGLTESNIKVTLCEKLDSDQRLLSGRNSKLRGERVELRQFLEKVGTQILLSSGESQDRAAERSLGYKHAEATIVFPYNVPSMTITALWCTGKFNGNAWRPLCERSRRTRADGSRSNGGI